MTHSLFLFIIKKHAAYMMLDTYSKLHTGKEEHTNPHFLIYRVDK